jgi:hypothetical protein
VGTSTTTSFRRAKHYLIQLTTLSPPSLKAPLLLYVSASQFTVSVALVQERVKEGTKRKMPIYFISEVLSPSKWNYAEMEKVMYAVLMASRKIRHYFQSYNIIVPLSQPLKYILKNKEAPN